MNWRIKLTTCPDLLNPCGSLEFPYETFPWRLEHGDRVCHFQCIEHLHKYLERHQLNLKKITIGNKYGESFISGKEYQKKLRQTTRKSCYRSSSSVRRRTPSMDSL